MSYSGDMEGCHVWGQGTDGRTDGQRKREYRARIREAGFAISQKKYENCARNMKYNMPWKYHMEIWGLGLKNRCGWGLGIVKNSSFLFNFIVYDCPPGSPLTVGNSSTPPASKVQKWTWELNFIGIFQSPTPFWDCSRTFPVGVGLLPLNIVGKSRILGYTSLIRA